MSPKWAFLAHFGDISYNVINRRISLLLKFETSYFIICCRVAYFTKQNLEIHDTFINSKYLENSVSQVLVLHSIHTHALLKKLIMCESTVNFQWLYHIIIAKRQLVTNVGTSSIKHEDFPPIKDVIGNVTKLGLFRPILVTFLIMSLIGENLHILYWMSHSLS